MNSDSKFLLQAPPGEPSRCDTHDGPGRAVFIVEARAVAKLKSEHVCRVAIDNAQQRTREACGKLGVTLD